MPYLPNGTEVNRRGRRLFGSRAGLLAGWIGRWLGLVIAGSGGEPLSVG